MTEKKERWQIAQAQEQRWWERRMRSLDFTYFARFAADLLKTTGDLAALTEKTRILEIGSGPAGIATHLPGFRVCMDPLEPFYARIDKCREYRDPRVRYLAAKGEGLPFPGDFFDLIIMDNMLDHCEDIDLVMNEIKRVLVADGVLYLRNPVDTRWGAFLSKTLEFFTVDKCHPYHFHEGSLRELVGRHGLHIVGFERRGFWETMRIQLSSGNPARMIRALSCAKAGRVGFALRKGGPAA